MADEADQKRHEARQALTQSILQKAREDANKKHNYDSVKTRTDLHKLFSERETRFNPHEWQIDVAEALLLGIDSVVIAGTGSGKTIPFMLPLLLHPDKMVLVISPLKVLQRDQARRFRKWKIPAAAVNGETWSPTLAQRLRNHECQAILTSPEMCLKHEQFRKWLSAKENTKDVLAVIIDEGHCISQWGGDFRPTYSQLEKLRAFVPSHIPMLLTSATFPPRALKDTCDRLNISLEKSFFLNLGNHRANIAPSVIHMDSAKDYEAIHKFLPDPNKITTAEDFEKTIIFTNAVNLTQVLCRDLRKRYGRQWHHYIDFLHANRTAKAKRRVMKQFRKGKIKILIATEAAGMGADIPDIKLIIQFGIPSSLSVWNQRAGRAGRAANIHARAILLVEKSMFKRKKKVKPGGKTCTKKPNESSSDESSCESDSSLGSGSEFEGIARSDNQKVWVKKVDDDLRQYITTKDCRNCVNDAYFDNPPRTVAPDSCDNCQRQQHSTSALNDSRPITPISIANSTFSPPASVHSTPSKLPNSSGKRPMTSTDNPSRPVGRATRRGDHLKMVRESLERWRYKTHRDRYSPSSFTAAGFLPDKILTTLASNARIKTLDDMSSKIEPPWIYTLRHGQEVLDLLGELDEREKADREQAKLAKKELRKKETIEHQNEKKRQKTLGRARAQAHTSRIMPPMIPQHILDGSSTYNVHQTPPTPVPILWQPSPARFYPGPSNHSPTSFSLSPSIPYVVANPAVHPSTPVSPFLAYPPATYLPQFPFALQSPLAPMIPSYALYHPLNDQSQSRQ